MRTFPWQRINLGGLLGLLVVVPTALAQTPDFGDPERVYIRNLPKAADGREISTEEPFISRDGAFLFFNSGEKENSRDLYFAEPEKDSWVFGGPIRPNINSASEVQGAPTMDRFFMLYFTDSSSSHMIRFGRFSAETKTLGGVRDLQDIPEKEVHLFRQRLDGNMDVEISADGNTLIVSRATWNLVGLSVGTPKTADLIIAYQSGRGFELNEHESSRIMEHVNTLELEYAPALSSDGLELYFTRLRVNDIHPARLRSRIMYARRNSTAEPFGNPTEIPSIGFVDFVEGPSISGDGNTLYFHRKDGEKFHIYRVQRSTQ